MRLSDHKIIFGYVLHFFLINLDIQNHYLFSVFLDKKTFGRCLRAYFLVPHIINTYSLIFFVKKFSVITEKSDKRFGDYVCLSRANFNGLVQTWCNWCAICNGILNFLIDVINEQGQKNQTLEALESRRYYLRIKIHIYLINKNLKFAVAKNKRQLTRIKPEDLFPNLYHLASPKIKCILQELTMSYNTIEQVEREWCPFKHIKRISYLSEQDSQRYQDYLDCEGFDDLIKAGKLLSQFNHIQCNDCVKLINEAFENKPKSEKPTPTEKFVQLIDKVSRASASFSATSIIS